MSSPRSEEAAAAAVETVEEEEAEEAREAGEQAWRGVDEAARTEEAAAAAGWHPVWAGSHHCFLRRS